MTLAAAFVAALLSLGPVQGGPGEPAPEPECPFQDPSPEVERLVEDLGSDAAETRQEAARRLRELGDPAVPRLKAAAYDRDAERSMAARQILLAIDARRRKEKGDRDERRPPALMAAVYYDWGRGVFFQMEPSGKVEMTLPVRNEKTGKREFRRYRADSLEDLRKEHPDAAREVDLSGRAPSEETREWWARTEKWLSLEPDAGKESEEEQRDGKSDPERLEAWRTRHREILDEFLKHWREQAPEDGPNLGALVGTPDASLRSQLALEGDSGVLVLEVREGGPAHRAGLCKHDVILNVAGEPVRDPREFGREVVRALKGGRFTLEVRRAGSRKELTVEPAPGNGPAPGP
jgi:hypothetical protein